MRIRPERPADAEAVRQLLIAAFDRLDEAHLADALRAEGVVEQALVAEDGAEIVGVMFLSRLDAPFPARVLAPLAVAPLWQGHGIGSALVRAAEGPAIFVAGEPEFYARHGFSADAAAGYACAFAGPYLMVRAAPDTPPTGRIFWPRAFSAAGSSDPR